MTQINEYFQEEVKNYDVKKILFALIISLLIGLFPGSDSVFAGDNNISTVTLTKEETVNQDYFAAGDTVNLSGTVNGDAYVAGGNVTFDGVINGDLLTAGGNITILGKITGDVRAAGGNIIVSSDVAKNATLLGGSIMISDDGQVGGSLVAGGGNVTINSPVGKGAHIAGGQISLGDSFGGSVNAYSSHLVLAPTVKISGDLNYWREKEIAINPEASISGQTTYHYAKTTNYKDQKSAGAADSRKVLTGITMGAVGLSIYKLIISFIAGLIFIYLLPVFTANTVKTLETRPLASLGIGFLMIVLFPVVFVILLITILGIPLAFLLMLLMALLWFISEIFVALYIGNIILKYFGMQNNSKQRSLFTGLLCLGLLSLIPFINFITGVLTCLFGIGALMLQKRASYYLLREKKLI